MGERLQKIFSAAGIASRRAAEKYISDGRVKVNGRTAKLGDSADPATERITLDGEVISKAAERVYIALNKPRGVLTAMSDDRGRRVVSELVSGVKARVYPIGRLDYNSEGLLLLTNDGETANRLMHPSHGVEKTYRVSVSGDALPESAEVLGGLTELDGGERISRARVRLLNGEQGRGTVEISISEGKKRQIRRMCAMAGLRVHRLSRVRIGEVTLGALRPGEWRFLSEAEIAFLRGV